MDKTQVVDKPHDVSNVRQCSVCLSYNITKTKCRDCNAVIENGKFVPRKQSKQASFEGL